MLLLTNTLIGGVYLILLFVLCFVSVVGIKAIHLELKRRKNSPPAPAPSEPPKEEPEKPRTREVYYLVEKKKSRRAKSKTETPKRIEFKNQS